MKPNSRICSRALTLMAVLGGLTLSSCIVPPPPPLPVPGHHRPGYHHPGHAVPVPIPVPAPYHRHGYYRY